MRRVGLLEPCHLLVAQRELLGRECVTTYSITLNASQLQSLIGGQLTVALDSTGGAGDAFYINSREAATNRPQLLLTAQ
jgi:hypothetical protein